MGGVLALAGCAGGDGDEEEPPLGQTPKVMRPADVPSLPMNQYVLDEKEMRAYTQAQAVLSRRCMERFGMSWLTDAQVTADLPNLGADPVRYFTIIDAEAARLHGYGDPDGQDAKEKGGTGGYEPTAAERAVYDGTAKGVTDTAGKPLPEGGCAAEVDKEMKLGGAEGVNPLTVGNEFYSLYAKVLRDSRVTGAFTNWSACMKEKGFAYQTPLDAANDTEWKSGAATRAAIAVATADVACKQQHNTVGIWYAAMAAHQNAYIDKKAEHFSEVLANKKALVENSARIMQGA
ncbi:hypothetical protein ACFVP0_09295 [Streptomyces cinereoruber]|uniref:hypothetical protein n=1 Tax=Streptomyces cinereoruber TaxID=67260 RepID=UPI003676C17C